MQTCLPLTPPTPHPSFDFFLMLDASGMKPPAVLWKCCAVLPPGLQTCSFLPALSSSATLLSPIFPTYYSSSGFDLNTIFFKKFFLGLGAFSSVPAAAPSSWHLSYPMLTACIPSISPTVLETPEGRDCLFHQCSAQMIENLPAMWETQVRSLGREDPLEMGMATHNSFLVWRIPWTEEPGGLQSW